MLVCTALTASACIPDETPTGVAEARPELAPEYALLAGSGPALTMKISSYVGGSQFEHARDVAVDAAGNVYVVGGTMSADFPTTAGVIQRILNPGTPTQPGIKRMDAFVMKLSPTGKIIWSTFLGGRDYDRAYAVEVDGQGNVYVAGRAGSGFPVTAGAFQTAFRGGQETTFYGPEDGFICKLNPTATARIYCSYFGTSDPRIIRDVAVDAQGNAYLASSVQVNGLPSTWFANAYQKTRAGGIDGVVAKVDPTGTRVLWATYVGGAGDEGPTPSIRVDGNGNVYYETITASGGLPTPNGFDHTLGGSHDLYLAKIAPAGDRLLYGTYIGGSGMEFSETHALALDGAGNAYVSMTTSSTNFPTTVGAVQRVYGGTGASGTGAGTNYQHDIGVVKLSPTGALLAGTYLGGKYGEGGEGIGVDGSGNVYVSGGSFSGNYPVTAPDFQGRGGGADVVVTRLAADFRSLRFSEQVGGSAFDVGRGVAVDGTGAVYIVGETASTNLYTVNALRSSAGGNTDAILLKLQ